MEEMQQREVHQKYLNMQIYELAWTGIYIAGLTFFYFMPAIFGGERNAECEMNTALANAMFGWVLLGCEAVILIGWIAAYAWKRSNDAPVTAMTEFLESATIKTFVAKLIINPLGYAIFFYWCQVLWTDMDNKCLEGYNLFDFILWLGLLVMTVF